MKITIEIDDSIFKEEPLKSINATPLSRVFDKDNHLWCDDLDYNRLFIKQQEEYLRHALKINGYVFLNDAYKLLGFPVTSLGQIVGWIYDENKPLTISVVSDGKDPDLILDFNVDGEILSRI